MDPNLPIIQPRYDFYKPNPIENCATRTTVEWIRLIFQVQLMLLTVGGNFIVIISVLVVKALRRPRNYLVLSLAVADLLVGLLVVPFKIALTENCDIWKAGNVFCYFWISVDIMCCTASILSLTVISLDRYIAIAHPLFYRVNATSTKAYVAVAVTWILSFFLTIPHWTLADLHHEREIRGKLFAVCISSQTSWHRILSVVGSFFLPLCIMIFVYITIWRVLGKQRSRIPGSLTHVDPQADAVATADSLSDGSPTPPPCLVCKMAEMLQERKGCIMIGIVMGIFILCWLPFFSLMLVDAIHDGILGKDLRVPAWVFDTFAWLGYFNSCSNPFIYTMFNQDFRFAFKELICLRGGTLNARIRSELYSKQMGSSSATANSTISSRRLTQRHQIVQFALELPKISSLNYDVTKL